MSIRKDMLYVIEMMLRLGREEDAREMAAQLPKIEQGILEDDLLWAELQRKMGISEVAATSKGVRLEK